MKSIKKRALTLFVASAALCGAAVLTSQNVGSQEQKIEIEYGKLYTCSGGDKTKFKVLSCENAMCQIFYVNPYSPGGGNTTGQGKSDIVSLIKREECTVQGVRSAQLVVNNSGAGGPSSDSSPGETVSPGGQFKVGDRVKFDHLLMKDPSMAAWSNGTIKRINGGFYDIDEDAKSGQSPLTYRVPVSGQDKWIRPLAASAPASTNNDAPKKKGLFGNLTDKLNKPKQNVDAKPTVEKPTGNSQSAGDSTAATNIRSQKSERTSARETAQGSGGLKVGEYACYGSGGQILIGLGFKVLSGNRYTDLDGKNAGTFRINGETVTFRGGHLDGQVGTNLRDYKFNIRTASCEPY